MTRLQMAADMLAAGGVTAAVVPSCPTGASACSAATSDGGRLTVADAEVRPFSEIQDGEVSFEADPLDPTAGIFRVDTTAANAIDGDLATEWSSQDDGDDEVVGPFPAGSPADPRVVEVEAAGQQLTFEVASSTGGNVGAVEVQVFGG